jgi:hypothetical protein
MLEPVRPELVEGRWHDRLAGALRQAQDERMLMRCNIAATMRP